jgi:hypothetical protein
VVLGHVTPVVHSANDSECKSRLEAPAMCSDVHITVAPPMGTPCRLQREEVAVAKKKDKKKKKKQKQKQKQKQKK